MPPDVRKEDLTEEKGIHAIVELQELAGQPETEEEARQGWTSMNEAERIQVMYFYEHFCKKPRHP